MPWGPLSRLLVVTALLFCSMAVVTPTLRELLHSRFPGDHARTSLFMAIHSLPQVLLLGLAVGFLSDRLGRRVPLAFAGAFGTGLATVIIPFLDSYPLLLAVRFLDGILSITAVGMLMTRALDLGTPLLRPRITAVFMVAIPGGYLLGSALTFLIGLAGGGVAAVYVSAGTALSLSALLLLRDWKLPEQVLPREEGLRAMAVSLRKGSSLWLPVLFGFVDKFSFALLATLPSLITGDRYGLAGFAAPGAVMTAYWIAFAAASMPAGALAARVGPWRLIGLGSLGYGLCLGAALMSDSPWIFLLFITLAGAFTALKFVPNLLLVGQMARPDERATAVSAFNLVGSFGLMFGFVYTARAVASLGYASSFALVGAVEIACALVAFYAGRRIPAPAREPSSASRPSSLPVAAPLSTRS